MTSHGRRDNRRGVRVKRILAGNVDKNQRDTLLAPSWRECTSCSLSPQTETAKRAVTVPALSLRDCR